jgi:MscS family membrane protein
MIRGTFSDFDAEKINKKEIRFLQSKIAINASRGNTLAVQRDKYLIARYIEQRERASFIQYLANASRDYETKENILLEAKLLIFSASKSLKVPLIIKSNC